MRGLRRATGAVSNAGLVYLIHFDVGYPRDTRAHVQHYCGWSKSRAMLKLRLLNHFKGHGSRLMGAVSAKGIGWQVVRIWWNKDRHFERKLKKRHQLSVFCPICQGRKPTLRAAYWRVG